MSEAAPLTRPYGVRISALSFRRGRTLAGPLKDGSLQGREGHTSGWLLSAFGRFAFSPSPTKFKKDFQTWVGEALGPPTRDVQHRKSPPSSASHALGIFSLLGRRITGGGNRTGSVGSTESGAVLKSHQF